MSKLLQETASITKNITSLTIQVPSPILGILKPSIISIVGASDILEENCRKYTIFPKIFEVKLLKCNIKLFLKKYRTSKHSHLFSSTLREWAISPIRIIKPQWKSLRLVGKRWTVHSSKLVMISRIYCKNAHYYDHNYPSELDIEKSTWTMLEKNYASVI